MNRKLVGLISILLVVMMLVMVGKVIYHIVDDHFTGVDKHAKVSEIVMDYLDTKEPEVKSSIQYILYNKAFARFEVTMSTRDKSTFEVLVDDKLKSIRDSRIESLYNGKLSDFLNREFQSRFYKVKSDMRVYFMTNKHFSERKDVFWITLINPIDISENEFQEVSLKILEWIAKQDYQLDKCYLDFTNEELTSNKFSLKVDSSNYREKDLSPYITKNGQ